MNEILELNNLTLDGLICGLSFGFIIGMYVRDLILKITRNHGK